MELFNAEQHYCAFKWAVSKDWKQKSRLYWLIQEKINILTSEYHLSRREIADDLFSSYWERGHYKRYNPSKGSLPNWVARYVYLYLHHQIRKYAVLAVSDPSHKLDPLDHRNQAQLVWADKDHTKEDPDYHPDDLVDLDNPEDLLIAKEAAQLIHGFFSATEIDYLTGELDLLAAAELTGIDCKSFLKRVTRHKQDFIVAVGTIH